MTLSLALAEAQTGDRSQPLRPQVHFSPERNWTNDPNGLVFYKGEYHLFFQYNPFGDQWGHMSWGHAVSPDLLHWKELPVAIPEANGVMIYTGSVVVDHGNSSGLCGSEPECLVAVYTGDGDTPEGHRETQNLAVSLDSGRTWTKYAGNPVLDLHMVDFRDPSVFRDEQRNRWVMAVALPKEHKVRLFSSPDLKGWTQLSDFGPVGDTDGDWECPDLLQVGPADPKMRGTQWVLKVGLNPGAPQGGSGEQYFFGDFDGTHFQASAQPGAHGWTNYGKDDYCAISFNGLPKGKQPILLGWMSNWQYAKLLPTSPWRGQMSLARQLSYVQDADGLALKQTPVVQPLNKQGKQIGFELASTQPEGLKVFDAPMELDASFSPGKAQVFGLKIFSDAEHWTEVGFDLAQKQMYMDRTHSGDMPSQDFRSRTVAPLAAGRGYDLQLIVDRSSVEAFAQGGTIAMTNLILPPTPAVRVVVVGEGGRVQAKISRRELDSIWGAKK